MTLNVDHSTKLVVVSPTGTLRPGATTFDQYRNSADLKSCTIGVPVDLDKLLTPQSISSFKNQWLTLTQKYRMPLLETVFVGNKYLILLSRQCVDKKILYSVMLEIFARQKFNTADHLGAPDFMPNVSEYRFQETGVR